MEKDLKRSKENLGIFGKDSPNKVRDKISTVGLSVTSEVDSHRSRPTSGSNHPRNIEKFKNINLELVK